MASVEPPDARGGWAALAFRIRCWCRVSWANIVGLTATAGLLSAIVLIVAAGAARTASVPDRYQAAYGGGADLLVTQEQGPPITEMVEALPAVEWARSVTFMFAGPVSSDAGAYADALVFSGTVQGLEARVVSGREPSPADIDEFVATPAAVESGGLEIGDSVSFVSLSPEDVAEYGFDPSRLNGPSWEARLVGVIDEPSQLDQPSALLLFSPALAAGGQVATASTHVAVRLTEGATEHDLRTQLTPVTGGATPLIEPVTTISSDMRTAVRGQSIGLWVLAGLGAAATSVAVGFLVARSVRLDEGERRSLAAIGCTRRQLILESTARAALVLTGAVMLATAIAAAASGIFPFGFARPLEPEPGIRVDPPVLGLAALVLLMAGIAWVAITSAMSTPDAHSLASTAAPSVVLAPAAALATWPAVSTGVRLASTGSGGRFSAIAPITATSMGIAAVVGTLTFGSSLERVVDEPGRYGQSIDFMFDNGASSVPPDQLAWALDQPFVSDVEIYRSTGASIGDESTPVMSSESLRGDAGPTLLAGRMPSGDAEVALGRVTARRVGADVGDTVAVRVGVQPVELRVVGLVVLPTIRGFDVLGLGAYVDGPAMDRLGVSNAPESAVGRLADDADREAARNAAADMFGLPVDDLRLSPPGAIVNLDRVTFVPFVLAAILFVLAIVTVIAAAWSGVRRRDRTLAILRAIGADRGWLRLAGLWQAWSFMAIPVLVGTLLGLVLGRTVFRGVAERTGVVSDPATPWILGSAALLAMVAIATCVTLLAGRRARRGPPAYLLRAE
jgi:hypothetical protein